MFVLTSNIIIGSYRFKVNEVKIAKSMFTYVDKATIKIPITARVVQDGEVLAESTETAKHFQEGEKVTIQLGYDGNNATEFEGFVARVNLTTPCEIECEGYSYQLRKKSYTRTFVNAELLDILTYLVAGTDITLDTERIPRFKIQKLILASHSGTEALELIKKIGDHTIQFFFTGKQLYGGLLYLNPKADVKYRLGWNVIKDGELKQRLTKNQQVTVHYVGEHKDGSKVKVTAGNGGETITKKSHGVTDKAALEQMANAKLNAMSYDGYEGKITTFGIPYNEPGNTADIEDLRYKERGGRYIVESIETSYGRNGFRRKVGIGAKL